MVPWTSSPGDGVCHEVPRVRMCLVSPWFPIGVSFESSERGFEWESICEGDSE